MRKVDTPTHPGIKPEPFVIEFQEGWFNKGDILKDSSDSLMKVTKVYKWNWFKQLCGWLGIYHFPRFQGKAVKVLPLSSFEMTKSDIPIIKNSKQ